MLYEMVTGRRAFEGKSHVSLIAAIVDHDPPPMSSLTSVSPPLLDHLVKTCLAKNPDKRWQTMADVLIQLRLIADSGGELASSAATRNRSAAAPSVERGGRARRAARREPVVRPARRKGFWGGPSDRVRDPASTCARRRLPGITEIAIFLGPYEEPPCRAGIGSGNSLVRAPEDSPNGDTLPGTEKAQPGCSGHRTAASIVFFAMGRPRLPTAGGQRDARAHAEAGGCLWN